MYVVLQNCLDLLLSLRRNCVAKLDSEYIGASRADNRDIDHHYVIVIYCLISGSESNNLDLARHQHYEDRKFLNFSLPVRFLAWTRTIIVRFVFVSMSPVFELLKFYTSKRKIPTSVTNCAWAFEL